MLRPASGSRYRAEASPPVSIASSPALSGEIGDGLARVGVVAGHEDGGGTARHLATGLEHRGEDGVEGLHDLGRGRELLDFFGGAGGVADGQSGVVGGHRVGDVDEGLAREIARGADDVRGSVEGHRQHHQISSAGRVGELRANDAVAALAGDRLRLLGVARSEGDRVTGLGEEHGKAGGHVAGAEDGNVHVGSP